MAYRKDADLEFLRDLQSEDLNDLVYVLTHDKDGKPRRTETLTQTEAYQGSYPQHALYWEEIAAELQCFGANTFATLLRGGEGVPYREVLMDVCDKVKANYNKESSTEVIESNLLMKFLTDALEKMSPEEVKALADEIGVRFGDAIGIEAVLAAFQSAFSAGGFKSYQLSLVVVNAVMKAIFGRGLTFAGNVILVRVLKILTGPIGWALTATWTAIDIASPAYRVTIPAVIQIAVLRRKHAVDQTEAPIAAASETA